VGFAGRLPIGLGLATGVGVLIEALGAGSPRPSAVVVAIPSVLFGAMFVLAEVRPRGLHRKGALPRALPSH
jgi:hypothetical protein